MTKSVLKYYEETIWFRNVRRFLSQRLYWIPLSVVIIGFISHSMPGCYTKETRSFLGSADSISTDREGTIRRIQELQSVEIHYHAKSIDLRLSREDQRMQFRSFHILILVALLSLIFLRETQDEKVQKHITYLTIVATCIMYVLDVHYMDLVKRDQKIETMHSNTLNGLNSLSIDNSTWYLLDFRELDQESDSVTSPMRRWPRKILFAITPNVDQILIYLTPTVYLLYRRRQRDKPYA